MKSVSPGIEELKAEAKPGRCIICEDRLPPRHLGRPRVICAHPGCRRTYHTVYAIDRRARARAVAQ